MCVRRWHVTWMLGDETVFLRMQATGRRGMLEAARDVPVVVKMASKSTRRLKHLARDNKADSGRRDTGTSVPMAVCFKPLFLGMLNADAARRPCLGGRRLMCIVVSRGCGAFCVWLLPCCRGEVAPAFRCNVVK